MVPLTDISSPVVMPCKIVPSNADSLKAGLPDLNNAMVIFFLKYIKNTRKTKVEAVVIGQIWQKTGKIVMNGHFVLLLMRN